MKRSCRKCVARRRGAERRNPEGTLSGGRYVVTNAEGKQVRRYRLAMEEHLGRKLEPHEVVHHINGDPTDDRIENLEVMDRGEHTSLHLKGNTITRGRKLSAETKRKMTEARKGNNYRLGTRQSDEARSKISAGLKRAYAEGRR
jgi:hypothetical protein